MSKTIKLFDGTITSALPLEGRLTSISASFSSVDDAIAFYKKLNRSNLSEIVLDDDGNVKTYSNRYFGSFTFETAPDSTDVRVRFSLIPPPAPAQGVDTAELDALKAENLYLHAQNSMLSEKAHGYDIITKGV